MWVLGAEIKWRQLPSTEKDVDNYQPQDLRIKVLGRVKLEITLRWALAKSLRGSLDGCRNEMYFTDAAFQQRTLVVTIGGGDFVQDREIDTSYMRSLKRPRPWEFESRYALRLCFNESPYPQEQNIKRKGYFGRDREVQELVARKNAVGRHRPVTGATGRAMNDPYPMGCVVS